MWHETASVVIFTETILVTTNHCWLRIIQLNFRFICYLFRPNTPIVEACCVVVFVVNAQRKLTYWWDTGFIFVKLVFIRRGYLKRWMDQILWTMKCPEFHVLRIATTRDMNFCQLVVCLVYSVGQWLR